MDIVIPYIVSRYEEIRYTLRSIEMHMKNVDDIYIIGEPPKWMKNVSVITATDKAGYEWKELNCHAKLMSACLIDSISDDFLYMNDDHFMCVDYDAATFPNYCNGIIAGESLYGKSVENTARYCGWISNFDLHCPMVFNKDRYVTAVGSMKWTVPYGYLIKSVYAFKNDIAGVQMDDCKVKYHDQLPPTSRYWFSCSDLWPGWELGKMTLKKMFPEKSKYEI